MISLEAWVESYMENIEPNDNLSSNKPNPIPIPIVTINVDKPHDWDDAIHISILVRGKIFLIDKNWLDFVCSRRFYIMPSGYMSFGMNGKKHVFHRFILDAPKGLVVDHINRNRNDNRTINLRIGHQSQNVSNRESKLVHGFRGIKKARNKWESCVHFNGVRLYLGLHPTKEDAAATYDKKAVECFGRFAVTNFPIENYSVPEKCLADDLPPTQIIRSVNEPCSWPNCDKRKKMGSEFCFRHSRVSKQREKKEEEGKYNRRIGSIQSEFCTDPSHRSEKVRTFCVGLCSFHYRKLREGEGYKKQKNKYRCSVLVNGNQCEKEAIKIKERLCSTHYKEKYKLFKSRGRPLVPSVKCQKCEEIGRWKNGLCKRHRLELWCEKNKPS